MGFSQVQIIGNTGRDPEMSYTPNGVAVTKFSVAVSRKTGDKEETTWYNCTAWRNLAETLNTHVRKGQQLFIHGELNARTYTTRDGKPGFSLDVTVEKFNFLGGKPQGAGQGGNVDDVDALGDLEEHPF